MSWLRLNTLTLGTSKALSAIGLGMGVWAATASADGEFVTGAMGGFDHGASSNSQDPGANSVQQYPSIAAPTTPGVQNTPQYDSFATPGAQNPSTGGWETSTAWNQPSNAWTGGGWSDTSQLQPYAPVESSYRPVPQGATGGSWTGHAQSTSYRSTTSATQFGGCRAAPVPATCSSSILIRMPEWESCACAYVLGDAGGSWNYTILPGMSQALSQDREWAITFDRGDGYGVQSYRLAAGLYEFRHADHGWELFRSPAGANCGPAFAWPLPQ